MIQEITIDGTGYIGFNAPYPKTPQEIEQIYASLRGEALALFQSVCAEMPSVDVYTKENAEKYRLPKEFFDVARVFTAQALPYPIEYFPELWMCHSNSFEHAQKTGCMYVEGIAISPAGPMLHTWNSTDGNNVLDFTWPSQELNRYYGAVLDIEELKKAGYHSGGILGHNDPRLGHRRKPIIIDMRTLIIKEAT